MKTLIIILFGIALTITARAQSFVTNVAAGITYSTLWTDTSLSVTNGEIIRINANGVWSPGTLGWTPGYPPDYWDNYFATADGYADDTVDEFFLNGCWGSMVAYVGTDPEQGYNGGFPAQTNGYWEVGSSVQFISNANGELWLGFNDDANTGDLGDNAGSQMVQIAINNATNSAVTNNVPKLSNGSFVLFNNSGIGPMRANTFSFQITNGSPYSLWAVYDSSDSTNWVFIGQIVLDATGSNTFYNISGVPRRYFKLDNGLYHTDPYGYRIFDVQFSYLGSPQQVWSDAFNFNGYWNLVQGTSFNGSGNPILIPGEGLMVNWTNLVDGSGSPSHNQLYIYSNQNTNDPPVLINNSISSGVNPIYENGLVTTNQDNYQLALYLNPANVSNSTMTNETYSVLFYSTNSIQTAGSRTGFGLINYNGPFTVNVANWSDQGSGQTDSHGNLIPYVTFTNLIPGTWTFSVYNYGTYACGPVCNGIQIIQIGGLPINLY